MASFDVFAPESGTIMLLFGARVSGLALVAPMFSSRPVPVMVRTGLVVAVVVMMVPVAQAHLSAPPLGTPVTVLSEVLVGFVIGLGAALLVGVAESAGELLAVHIGLQGSAIVDPLQQQQTTALGQFMQLFALALLLSMNAHVVMLDALATSLRLIPVGHAVHITDSLWRTLALGGALFALGLQFAAPVIALVLLGNVALALLSRAAPAFNILTLAFPVQILIGLGALIALVPLLGTVFLGWENTYDDFLTRALPALRGGR